MEDLDSIRDQINSIDEQILKALKARREFSDKIIRTKAEQEMPLRDARREEELLSRLIQKGRESGLDAHFVTRVFHQIIDDSIRSQELFLLKQVNQVEEGQRRVGFQGIEGAYSHLAAQKFFSAMLEGVTFVGYSTFADVVEAVEQGELEYGMLPVENTTAGSINEVYDLLSRATLSIVGEEIFRVDHCLLAIEDVPVSKIRRILSHPQALAQCMKFLSSLENCQREYFADTAMAVRKVKEDQDLSQAAIASEEAGKRYGLKVIQRNLADQIDNYTRFLIAARQPIKVDERIPAKTSLILAVPHEEGALLRALNVIHNHKINLTKLESRPKAGSPFEYLFYIDFEGNVASPGTRAALDELKGATTFLKVLGTYPMEARSKTPPAIQALVTSQQEEPDVTVEEPPPPAEDSPYKLASRSRKPEGTVVSVRGFKIGSPDFAVIAGPCSVESREQIFACARRVKECGGGMLRGSCFRARTSPQGFQGLGYKGLAYLSEAGREYDLPVVTEVISPADVEPVAALADVLLVGSRNMQNYSLLRELGNISKPVILKRGMMSTLEELLSSAEYILGHGNQQVILCERGIRTFEMVTRNTLDLGAIPILKRLTHLPLLVDPSHAAGQRELVVPLALAAHAVGPHGLMVEIHPEPEKALSEGAHALRFGEFAGLMRAIYGNGGKG